jgi:FMN phosphatase YigB (HAD superfamily)
MTEAELHSAARRNMKIIFDLDGTLALTDHRAHFLKREKKDWRSFYAACDQDQPCHPIIRTMLALYTTGADVEIWTGRSMEVFEKTRAWLEEQGAGFIPIRMREEGDHRPDTVLKEEWLNHCDAKPRLVFEDRASVVAMWRSHGIVCAQVAPGDF